jgi:hypothetical protein
MGAKHSFTLTCAGMFATQAAVHTLGANRECRGASKGAMGIRDGCPVARWALALPRPRRSLARGIPHPVRSPQSAPRTVICVVCSSFFSMWCGERADVGDAARARPVRRGLLPVHGGVSSFRARAPGGGFVAAGRGALALRTSTPAAAPAAPGGRGGEKVRRN